MTGPVDEFDQFRLNYTRSAGVLGEIEQQVIGARYGANGYTTRAQADLLAERLDLDPSATLLDVGTGCGWPSLYLSATSGCSVVATDVPIEGLERAARRAESDGLDAGVVMCAGHRLPFRAASFDAITHTDALC